MNLAASYALDSFGGLKEVGAALDHAIAGLAREYKHNNANLRRKVAKRDEVAGIEADNSEKENFSLTDTENRFPM